MRYAFLAALSFFLVGCATLKSNVSKWDFGTVYVGETHTSNNINWTNSGKDPVDVIGVAGSWNAGGPFSLQPVPYTGSTLTTNAVSNPVQVVFLPTTSGTFQGTLDTVHIVPVGQKCTSDTVSIKGTAVAQVAQGDLNIGGPAITPGSALDFGKVRANAGPAVSRRVDVLNMGTTPILVQARFRKGGQGFTVVSPAGNFTIPAGKKVTVKLQFLPTTVGACWDVIEFVDTTNSANLSATSLTGLGVE